MASPCPQAKFINMAFKASVCLGSWIISVTSPCPWPYKTTVSYLKLLCAFLLSKLC